MTWEWVFLISVVIVCGTGLICFFNFDNRNERHEQWILLRDMKLAVETVQSELEIIQADHEAVAKLADEGKKLLSQANLAAGFHLRGQR